MHWKRLLIWWMLFYYSSTTNLNFFLAVLSVRKPHFSYLPPMLLRDDLAFPFQLPWLFTMLYLYCFKMSTSNETLQTKIRGWSCFSNQEEKQVHSQGRLNALLSDTWGISDEMVKTWENIVCHYWLNSLSKKPHQRIYRNCHFCILPFKIYF